MRIHVRGLVVELSEDDPRAREIERMLFGTTGPEVVATPGPVASGAERRGGSSSGPSERPSAPVPGKPPGASVPPVFRQFWRRLRPLHRQELELLTEREWPVAELEARLRLKGVQLRGLHTGMGHVARHLGLPFPIRSSGYGRARRRFVVDEPVASWVRAMLAEDAQLAEHLGKSPVPVAVEPLPRRRRR